MVLQHDSKGRPRASDRPCVQSYVAVMQVSDGRQGMGADGDA